MNCVMVSFLLAEQLASFDSQATAVGIRGTAGTVGTPGAEGIVDRVRRDRRAVAAVGVTGRIGVERVRAQLAAVVPLLVVEPRRIRGDRIGRARPQQVNSQA